LNMISTVSVEAAVAAIRAVVDGIAKLEAAVTNLERVERDRMTRLQLALWDHRSATRNGHGKGL